MAKNHPAFSKLSVMLFEIEFTHKQTRRVRVSGRETDRQFQAYKIQLLIASSAHTNYLISHEIFNMLAKRLNYQVQLRKCYNII